MDFMKWLNSLDEFLYQVMSWLVFFPVTLWRTIVGPLTMMDYADRQLTLPEDDQYADSLSPPLFLALGLLVAHGANAALGQTDAIVANRHGLSGLVNDDSSALVLRLFVFAIFPLVSAVRLVRRQGLRLDRKTLRLPFYAQCYPAAIFALGLTFGTLIGHLQWAPGPQAGLIVAGSALLYYFVTETRWFAARLSVGILRASGAALLSLFEGFVLLVVVGYLFTR